MILRTVAAAGMLLVVSSAGAARDLVPPQHSLCSKYQVFVSGREALVPNSDVKRWAEYALKSEGRYIANGPCVVLISVIAMAVENKGGIKTGWVAALNISTRRWEREDRMLISDEYATVFTGAAPDEIKGPLRESIERFISELK